MRRILLVGTWLLPLVLACSKPSQNQMVTAILEDSSILIAAMKKDPVRFKKNVVMAAEQSIQEQELAEERVEENRYNNPLKPSLSDTQVYRGADSAKVVIVEYTDFECPHCSKASHLLHGVLAKYEGKVKVTYKHYPLSGHLHSRRAAQYFEAIRMQNPSAALKFHDALFAKQTDLQSKGEKFLSAEAKKLGLDMAKLNVDMFSEAVTAKIVADSKEAEKFGFDGTPAFLVGGIPVPGYLAPEKFEKIVEKVLDRKKG